MIMLLELGIVGKRLRTQGYVCIADDYEECAVRIEARGDDEIVFIKRKGHKEIPTLMSEDCVQDIICERHNRELTREEYDEY